MDDARAKSAAAALVRQWIELNCDAINAAQVLARLRVP